VVTGLPDWWYGRRLPEPTLVPLHFKLCAVGTWVDPATGEEVPVTGTVWASVGTPEPGYVWQIHRVWAINKDDNSLIEVFLAWGSTASDVLGSVIHRARGYGNAVIEIPKGLDYVSGNYLQIGTIVFAPEGKKVYFNWNGIEIKLE